MSNVIPNKARKRITRFTIICMVIALLTITIAVALFYSTNTTTENFILSFGAVAGATALDTGAVYLATHDQDETSRRTTTTGSTTTAGGACDLNDVDNIVIERPQYPDYNAIDAFFKETFDRYEPRYEYVRDKCLEFKNGPLFHPDIDKDRVEKTIETLVKSWGIWQLRKQLQCKGFFDRLKQEASDIL